jgi:hypothetical protein
MEAAVSKYAALGQYLRQQMQGEVRITFAEIERITGSSLPPSALKHRPWWSNNAKNSVMTRVWMDAGFRSAQVDMEGRKLTFRRVRPNRPDETEPAGSMPTPSQRRHPLFGALKGLMRIMPGTDLTRPADPDWGKVG